MAGRPPDRKRPAGSRASSAVRRDQQRRRERVQAAATSRPSRAYVLIGIAVIVVVAVVALLLLGGNDAAPVADATATAEPTATVATQGTQPPFTTPEVTTNDIREHLQTRYGDETWFPAVRQLQLVGDETVITTSLPQNEASIPDALAICEAISEVVYAPERPSMHDTALTIMTTDRHVFVTRDGLDGECAPAS